MAGMGHHNAIGRDGYLVLQCVQAAIIIIIELCDIKLFGSAALFRLPLKFSLIIPKTDTANVLEVDFELITI